MTQNVLHTAWTERFTPDLDEEYQDSARKSNIRRSKRNAGNNENETFFNSTVQNQGNGLLPNLLNFSEDTPFQRRSNSTRYLDETEYEATNLPLKYTPSTDTIHSKGSRNFKGHSPPGSYSGRQNTPKSRIENNKSGINIIMLMGFTIGIAFGTIFNLLEVYLKWMQSKIADLQLRTFGGISIQTFYVQNESILKKILLLPVGGFILLIQSISYVLLVSIGFLKKPAPKSLVSNIMTHYMEE